MKHTSETLSTISTVFAPWKNTACWIYCNEEKQPVEKRTGVLCKWKSNPQDNIIPFTEIEYGHSKGITWGGFGIILGHDNFLACVDLDHCIEDEKIKNPEIIEFLKIAQTYTEISVSGTGLHVFFLLEKSHDEFGLRTDFSDGKFYPARFIKLTGVKHELSTDVINPIREKNFDTFKEKIGASEPVIEHKQSVYTGGSNEKWETILYEAKIPFYPSEYTGKIRRGKRVVESWKIECPNRKAHNTDRTGDLSAHMAILNKYDDGCTSVTCNHNSCDPSKKPNLLQKLWDRVKKTRPYSQKKEVTNEETIITLPELTESEVSEIRMNHTKSFGDIPEVPEGFFKNYMEYGKRMSYAWEAYHFAGALTLASMICGRRVMMQSTAAKIFPNVFIACVGATSISGKSTANDMVSDFFTLVEQEGTCGELPKKMSPQGLIQRLETVPCRYWAYDECSEFFSDTQAHWAESLESNLCSIYDGRATGYGLSDKKNQKSEWMVKDVFVSCLWNTTDAGIEDNIQAKSVASGFVPRFMWFWLHDKNTPRKNREISNDDIQEKLAIQRKIQDVRSVLMQRPVKVPSIIFSPNELIENWLLEDNQTHLEKKDEVHRICTARIVPQAYKIAMLLTIMDDEILNVIRDEKPEKPLYFKIPDRYASFAKDMAEIFLRPRLEYVIDLAINNDKKNYIDMIKRCIQKHGSVCSKSQIIRDTRIQQKTLQEALDTMVEGEILQECVSSDKTVGRRAILYKLL